MSKKITNWSSGLFCDLFCPGGSEPLLHRWKLPQIGDDSLECTDCGWRRQMVPRGAFQAELERNRRALSDSIDEHENRDRANLAARILGDDVHAYLDMEKGFWNFYGPDGPIDGIPVDGIWGSR